MLLAEVVEQFFSDWKIRPKKLLVAVSGGPDSTALLLALVEWKSRPFPLAAAHVNHQLRGKESDEDEAFIRALCDRLSLPIEVLDGPLSSGVTRERGVEAAAREARYAALRACRDSIGADWIATAHQQSDQAETLLIRLVTGTGPGRLGGIPPTTKDRIARPFLGVPEEEIQRFLSDRGIRAREDRMNRDPRFVRTRVRTELIPLLASFNPRIVRALAETARQTREQQEAVRWLLADAAGRWVERSGEWSKITLEGLPDLPWLRRAIMMREIQRLDPEARDISAADLERIVASLSNPRRTSIARTLTLIPKGGAVELRRSAPAHEPFEKKIAPGETLRLPDGSRFRLERLADSPPEFESADRMRQRFQLPGDSPDRSFIVRSRRRGDRFEPLGAGFEKKLSDLMIDRKIPRERRDAIPLLVWNDQIVWVGGVEISDRFKVSEPWRETFEARIEADQ